jgi:hypothetical protein
MNLIFFILLILSSILEYINAKHLLDNNNNNVIYYNIALTNIIILSIVTFFTIIFIIYSNSELTTTYYNIIIIFCILITICNILSCTTSIILINENIKDLSKIIPAIIYLSIVCIILLQKIINPNFNVVGNFIPSFS